MNASWKQIKQIIFDADDTLWENNIYYVQATNDFFDLIETGGFNRSDIQKAFDDLELKVVQERGYGSHNFVYILEDLFTRYKKETALPLDEKKFRFITKRFKEHPTSIPQLFTGVIETLRYLKGKYKLYVLTKGEYEEQQGKILRAGVHECVQDYFILAEKNDAAYRRLLKEHNWQAHETCMVGNSPKSDINPALRQGMFAIHIPYRDTWKLDDEPIEARDGRFMELESFEALQNVF